MMRRYGWTAALGFTLFFAGAPRILGQVQERSLPRILGQVQERSLDEIKAIEAEVEESIGWYQMFADASAREPMPAHRVLRWLNATRKLQPADGIFVLWVDKGRPEASASVYPWNGFIGHNIVSLSRSAKLVAREKDQVIWSPKTPGVEFHDIPGAAAPADSPAARLRQMKDLADRFKVTMTGWNPSKTDREVLRMLPKLLYRYEPGAAQGADRGWTDGGVYAFVQGTDPEAILLLEAVRTADRPRWQYAFARATAAGLEARLDQTMVWEVRWLTDASTPLLPQTALGRELKMTAPGRKPGRS
jgi:hypothetical protein